jgi:hypothetical protein
VRYCGGRVRVRAAVGVIAVVALTTVLAACGGRGSAGVSSTAAADVTSSPASSSSDALMGAAPAPAGDGSAAVAAASAGWGLTLRNGSDRTRTFVVFQTAPKDSGAQVLAWQVRTVAAGQSALLRWTDVWSVSWGTSWSGRWVDGKALAPGTTYRARGLLAVTGSNGGNFLLTGPAESPHLYDSRRFGDPIAILTGPTAPSNVAIGVDKNGATLWARPATAAATAYGFDLESVSGDGYRVATADVEQGEVLDDATLRSAVPVQFQGSQMHANLQDDGTWAVGPGSTG